MAKARSVFISLRDAVAADKREAAEKAKQLAAAQTKQITDQAKKQAAAQAARLAESRAKAQAILQRTPSDVVMEIPQRKISIDSSISEEQESFCAPFIEKLKERWSNFHFFKQKELQPVVAEPEEDEQYRLMPDSEDEIDVLNTATGEESFLELPEEMRNHSFTR